MDLAVQMCTGAAEGTDGKGAERGARVLVLGLGNPFRRDDGLGPAAVKRLREHLGDRPDVELVEGGLSPFEALLGRGGGKLVVIDAARGGGEPGTIYRAGRSGLEPSGAALSTHGLGLAEALCQLELVGDRWEDVVVFGVEPADTGWGEGLTARVEEALEDVLELVEAELVGPTGEVRPRGR